MNLDSREEQRLVIIADLMPNSVVKAPQKRYIAPGCYFAVNVFEDIA
jgi:hypothetical protein